MGPTLGTFDEVGNGADAVVWHGGGVGGRCHDAFVLQLPKTARVRFRPKCHR
jgi:hypothetical protein